MLAIKAGGDDKVYEITVADDFSIDGSDTESFGSVTGLEVTITGEYTISLSSSGAVLSIAAEQSVFIDDVDFVGILENKSSVLMVNGGALTLRGDASVSGNTLSSSGVFWGGGVSVSFGGLFVMEDNASVFGNTAPFNGGGVYVSSDEIFTMKDNASVFGNTARNGGGIFVDRGTFVMKENASLFNNIAYDGGGVYVESHTTFIMEDSVSVSNNTASNFGGGVFVYNGGTFNMLDDLSVSGNTAGILGGGVYVDFYSTCQISGGTIYGNNVGTQSNRVEGIGRDLGAALSMSGTAQYGTFNGDTFIPSGNLSTTDNTIRVVNGVLQAN